MAKKMTRAALFFMIGTVILTAFYKKATYGPALSLAITYFIIEKKKAVNTQKNSS